MKVGACVRTGDGACPAASGSRPDGVFRTGAPPAEPLRFVARTPDSALVGVAEVAADAAEVEIVLAKR